MRRVLVSMHLFGALVCLSGVWTTQSTPESKRAEAIVSGVLAATGLVLAAVRRPSRRLLEVVVLWSVAVLGGLIARSDPLGSAPLFYLWAIVFAAYFCSTRVVVTVYLACAASLATGLALNETHILRLDTFDGVMSAVGLIAFVVTAMTNRERRLRTALAEAAEVDPLTGLHNRRAFNPRLDAMAAAAAVRHRPFSLVMFDLDHFKRVNDEHGHLFGDEVLRRFGAILRAQSREEDLAGRFGGEEFTAALPGADTAQALRFAERVAAAFAELAADGFAPAVSAGVCSLTAEGESGQTLLQRADAALYAAKEGGRCRPAVWAPVIRVGARFDIRPRDDRRASSTGGDLPAFGIIGE